MRHVLTIMTLFICFCLVAFQQNPRPREGDLKVGQKAPDFTLQILNSDEKFTLSSNFNKQATFLIFGSYT